MYNLGYDNQVLKYIEKMGKNTEKMFKKNKKNKKGEWKIDFKYNLRLYFSMLKNYKILTVGLLIIILVLQASHVLDKYLFKEIIDRGTEFTNGTLSNGAFIHILLIIAGIYIVIHTINVILRWLHLHLINHLDGSLMLDLKKKFFNHLVHLSYNFHTSNKTGTLISRLIRSGGAIERMTDVLVFNFVPIVFQVIVTSLSLLYFDVFSAITVLVIVVIFMAFSLFINQAQQKSKLKANDAEDFEKGNISDIFTNIESVKYFGKEKNIKNKYARIGLATKRAMIANWNYFRWLSAGHSLILVAGTFMIVYFPLIKMLNGAMSIGSLVFIYTVYGNLFAYLFGFDHGIRNYYRAMADFESLFQYYKIRNEIEDKSDAKVLKVKQGTIEFRNIGFKYKKKKILNNFDLRIKKNQKIALVGPSGSGKTTIIRLLYRLFDVDEGAILIDGKNINEFKQESLRSELSIVPQECVLFDDTICNNIMFSRPNAKKEDVKKASKFAQLDEIISELPLKDKTIVGERGVKLSGGEKQRVSIARAILANKKILVMDEATSALDSETEHEIQKDLEKLMQGRTSIIIAHRLSTIMKADVIVVMDKGKIVQKGTHNQLIKTKGMYKTLWNLQKGGYIK